MQRIFSLWPGMKHLQCCKTAEAVAYLPKGDLPGQKICERCVILCKTAADAISMRACFQVLPLACCNSFDKAA